MTAQVGEKARKTGGEQLMVPPAEVRSYYGLPVVKETVWGVPEVPGYLFLGGLAGASSALAAGAELAGYRELARTAKTTAAGAIGLSVVALVKDLGRPERFLNMLRVFKPTSPMSVGSWILSAYAPAAGVAAGCAITGLLPAIGRAATVAAAVTGPGIAAYTSALLADTAVPAWHEAHRELPYLFVSSAATAAGGLALALVPPEQAGPARKLALVGAGAEVTAKSLLTRRLGLVAEPYQSGESGRLMEVAEILTTAGLTAAALGGRNRLVTAAAGVALVASSAFTRFGIFYAGRESARDPRYTIAPQKARAQATELSSPNGHRSPFDIKRFFSRTDRGGS
jgi:DMSO reductase anchor subunit